MEYNDILYITIDTLDQGFFGVIYDNLDVGDIVKRLPRISV